ncbi:hypothetical protein KEM54_004158 [Ascosphaera aggregata]|nr:hypothetical protein KEM54_004158 [Ascosphaera aggregata]
MSAIKLFRPAIRAPNLRQFTTSSRYYKVPSIRDITPGEGESFRHKQRKFRDKLEELRQAKEKQERNDAGVSSSVLNDCDVAADATALKVNNDGLPPESQLTKHDTGVQFMAEEVKRGSKGSGGGGGKRGRLSNLIYGTAEGRKLDNDIERSFSEVVARGKYVHSIVFHEVKPDKVEEYVDLVSKWYPRMASTDANRVKLVGSWRTQVGDNDTFGELFDDSG